MKLMKNNNALISMIMNIKRYKMNQISKRPIISLPKNYRIKMGILSLYWFLNLLVLNMSNQRLLINQVVPQHLATIIRSIKCKSFKNVFKNMKRKRSKR